MGRKCITAAAVNNLDQITKDNKVLVVAGDNRLVKYVNMGEWEEAKAAGKIISIGSAFVKYDEDAIIKMNKDGTEGPQYDVAVLISDEILYKERSHTRAPICLAALNAKIGNNQIITTVGWGEMYTEYPDRNLSNPNEPRNPEATSCSTNKHGPKYSRFKKCDVTFLRNNQWKCQKFTKGQTLLPSWLPKNSSGHTVYDYYKCKKYFAKTKLLISNQMKARGIKWTKQYPDVKNIIVKHYNRNTKTECYRK